MRPPLHFPITMSEHFTPPQHRSRRVRWLLFGVVVLPLLLGLISIVRPLPQTMPLP
jgi:hypothetical protein